MKDYKQQQKDRKKTINEKKKERQQLATGHDSRKVHDTKGRNQHGRRY